MRRRSSRSVDSILKEIGADKIRNVVVYNKSDLVPEEALRQLEAMHPDAVFISALDGKGLRGLLFRIAQEAAKGDITMTVEMPYEKGILMSMLHERCQILHEEYHEGGLRATAKVPERLSGTFEPYRLEG
jgi:GTP-binding protein HflX